MAGKAIAVDFGSKSYQALVLKDGKHGLVLERFTAGSADEATRGLAGAGIPLKGSVAGLAGRDMTLRYTQVPPSPDWQLRNLMELEIQDMSGQTGGELSADYNLLPIEDEDGGMETVLLAFARNEALDGSAGLVSGAGGSIDAHVPNCVGLYNAYMRCGPVDEDSTVCLANLGHETIDLAIVRGVDLLFVRNLAQGGKVFDDAIAAAFNVGERKAEALKKELLDVDPFSRGRYASGQAEKVTVAAGGSGSMIVSAIQSSLAFCRNQTRTPDLQLDKLLICGGTSRVKGLTGMLREALRCPVEVFDPFESVDTSKLPADEFELLDANRREAVVALGLAAGKVDGSLYQLEILPESVKRRRRFLQQTIWVAAAILVAVGLLVGIAVTEQSTADAATAAARRNQAIVAQIRSVDGQARALVEENQKLEGLIAQLAERAVPLDGTILTLRALQDTMPDEFWVNQLEVVQRAMKRDGDPRGRRTTGEPRPLVVLKGSGKDVSGGGVVDPYTRFLTQFKSWSYGGAVAPFVETKNESDGLGNSKFEWTIDFRPPVQTGPEEEQN